MERCRVLYYDINDSLEYERSLLKEWGVDSMELVQVKCTEQHVPFADCAADVHGAVVEYEQVTRPVLERLKKLRVISLQSIGYNNIDIGAATDCGICVTNAPGFCTPEVAATCVGLLLDLARNLSYLDRDVRAGHWQFDAGPKMRRLAGKTVGLVFFGSIPKAMLPMLKALKLRILVYAPTKSPEYLADYGVEKAETLEELLEASDFVSLHMPLNEKTRHMIGEPQLKRMKKTAFLINTARGAVVDEPALVEALKNGTIAGAAVDVIEDEEHHCSGLIGLDNAIVTPHAAFLSEDSFYSAREIALRQLVQCLVEHKAPENLVNREMAEKF
jgi:D-3-phosphoglycerate dehydrogenase